MYFFKYRDNQDRAKCCGTELPKNMLTGFIALPLAFTVVIAVGVTWAALRSHDTLSLLEGVAASVASGGASHELVWLTRYLLEKCCTSDNNPEMQAKDVGQGIDENDILDVDAHPGYSIN